MSEEPEIALVGCTTVAAGLSSVPSDIVPCDKCGEDVWLSHDLQDSLMERGYAMDDIKALCLYTCVVVPADSVMEITDRQRANLRERGLTDAQIDDAVQIADQLIQREEP